MGEKLKSKIEGSSRVVDAYRNNSPTPGVVIRINGRTRTGGEIREGSVGDIVLSDEDAMKLIQQIRTALGSKQEGWEDELLSS